MNVGREEVLEALKRAMEGVRGIKGIHVCANTDWPLVLEAGFDIVNFDAYGYRENFLLWAEQIRAFLERGGIVAWGIVPTDAEALKGATTEELLGALLKGVEELRAAGLAEGLLSRFLITPSCGTGSLGESEAEKVYGLLQQVSETLKDRLGDSGDSF